jgi:hypothetical protein
MNRKLSYRGCVGLMLLFCAAGSWAQNTLDNPDWVEEQAPPPPAYSKTNLIPITMPPYVSTQIGVDPATVSTGADGIVRYVVVMTNTTGTSNASYEGIRCITDEVKTYARMGSSGQWSLVSNPQWKPINDNMPSRHAHAIARQGACDARLAPQTAEVMKSLKLNASRYKPNLGL